MKKIVKKKAGRKVGKKWFLILVGGYLFTRLYQLTLLPIFTDEAIYIYWAQFIATNHSNWFISLTDGKPPLLIWSIVVFLKLLPASYYLMAGRLVSVGAGLLGLVGIYRLTRELFSSERTALMTGALYVLLPFTLLYDRMAMFDALLSAMMLWAVYLAVRMAKSPEVARSLWWGGFLGLGFLAKAPAILYWVLTPVMVLILRFRKTKKWFSWKLVGLVGLAMVVGQGINNLQRLSSVYYLTLAKNTQFQRKIGEIIANPLEGVLGRLGGLFSWIVVYYTTPILMAGVVALGGLIYLHWRRGLSLLMLWLGPIVMFAVVAQIIFPRYILLTTPYFLIALAFGLDYLLDGSKKMRVLGMVVGMGLMVSVVGFDFKLLTAPDQAPMPFADYHQYVSDHPSGYGLDQIFVYLNEEIKKEPITVITEGTFGVMPYALMLEYWGDERLEVIPVWPIGDVTKKMLVEQALRKTVYVLTKDQTVVPNNLPLVEVVNAEKPGGKARFLLAKFDGDN